MSEQQKQKELEDAITGIFKLIQVNARIIDGKSQKVIHDGITGELLEEILGRAESIGHLIIGLRDTFLATTIKKDQADRPYSKDGMPLGYNPDGSIPIRSEPGYHVGDDDEVP